MEKKELLMTKDGAMRSSKAEPGNGWRFNR
jgi:hypothetical protein